MPTVIRNPAPVPTPVPGNAVLTLRANPHRVPDSAPAYLRLDGKVLTRGELVQVVDQLAWSLRHTLGLSPGDRVAVLAPNSTYYPVVLHACLAAGVVAVPVSPAYGVDELVHPFADSNIKYAFVTSEEQPLAFVRTALEKIGHPRASDPSTIWLLSDADALPTGPRGEKDLRTLLGPNRLDPQPVSDPANTTAFIGYSSGTTGKSKGTILSHANMSSMVSMLSVTDQAGPNRLSLAVLPMYHIFSLMIYCLEHYAMGAPVVVAPGFSLESCLTAIQRFKIQWMAVAPPILVLLAKSPVVEKYDLTSLTAVVSGAAPLSDELARQVETRFPGLYVSQGYGLTETSPVVSIGEPREYSTGPYRGSAGRIIPGIELRLMDPETGKDLSQTEGQGVNGGTLPGEIWVRGPSVFTEYLNNPDATRDSFPEPGWFATGDVGYVNGGYLFITDRIKELIKTGGRQVAPAELEGLLLDHPKVADAAVVPVYVKAKATEYPVAFIVPASLEAAKDPKLTAEVQSFVDEKVVFYKRLRGGVRVIDAIPKSGAGKILRRILKEQVRVEQEALEAKAAPKAKL